MHNNQVRKAKTCKGLSELAFKFKVIFLQTAEMIRNLVRQKFLGTVVGFLRSHGEHFQSVLTEEKNKAGCGHKTDPIITSRFGCLFDYLFVCYKEGLREVGLLHFSENQSQLVLIDSYDLYDDTVDKNLFCPLATYY